MEWISVSDRFPEEVDYASHHRKLWLNVPPYGAMVGFYMDGKFWKNYACQIIGTKDWMELPEPPNE